VIAIFYMTNPLWEFIIGPFISSLSGGKHEA